MLPDGTGGLVSCAEAELNEQARPVSAAAVCSHWNVGHFMIEEPIAVSSVGEGSPAQRSDFPGAQPRRG